MPPLSNQTQGDIFRCWQKNADGAAVADNASQTWAIDLTSLATGKFLNLSYDAVSSADSEIQLWETITYADGNAFTPLNKHRGSSKTAATGVVIKSGATITTTNGTQLVGRWIPGGAGTGANAASTPGNAISSVEVWSLKHGVKYALILINRGGSAQDMSLGFHFRITKGEGIS